MNKIQSILAPFRFLFTLFLYEVGALTALTGVVLATKVAGSYEMFPPLSLVLVSLVALSLVAGGIILVMSAPSLKAEKK